MTKHTQGPWFTGYNEPKVVYPENGHVKDHALHPLATVHDFDGEAEANARLIASAPELLAALDDLTRFHELGYSNRYNAEELIKNARAAIAKAKE